LVNGSNPLGNCLYTNLHYSAN